MKLQYHPRIKTALGVAPFTGARIETVGMLAMYYDDAGRPLHGGAD